MARTILLFLKNYQMRYRTVPGDNIIILGSDFNCTLNQQLDRNNNEPHPPSAKTLKNIVDHYNLSSCGEMHFLGIDRILG